MALPEISNCYRCAVDYLIGSMPAVNVFHTANAFLPNAEDMANAVAAAWGMDVGLSVLLSSETTYTSVTVTPLDGHSASAVVDFSEADNAAGASGGHAVPPQVAATVSLATAKRGRSYRGRMFIGGVQGGRISDPQSQWDSEFPGDMHDVIEAFIDQLDSELNGTELHVASYLHSTSEKVTSHVTRLELGTVRLRARP